jgi:hypothetical protein
MMKDFEYFSPKTVEEVLSLLSEHGRSQNHCGGAVDAGSDETGAAFPGVCG